MHLLFYSDGRCRFTLGYPTIFVQCGVTHKIEGFFELCKKRGLTGRQGVIISQGIELLMETPAGELDENGDFPADTVHGYVSAKLRSFAQLLRNV